MTTHITSRYATTLGPFLTLLVLTASRGTNTAPDRLATVETAPVEVAGERAKFQGEGPRTHGDAIALGPFLTLIVTLRRRKGNGSGSWPRGSVAWGAAAFIRIHASE